MKYITLSYNVWSIQQEPHALLSLTIFICLLVSLSDLSVRVSISVVRVQYEYCTGVLDLA